MKTIRSNIIYTVAKFFFRPHNIQDAIYQQNLVLSFVKKNKNTVWWKLYNYDEIKTVKDFQNNVPLSTYDDIQPYIEQMLQWKKNVLRTWKIDYFSKSSWTTALSKYLPISYDALHKNHYRVWKDWFWYYLTSHKESKLFVGQWLIMWWRLWPNPFNQEIHNVGDVSAILQYHTPWIAKLFRKPSQKISFMEHFDQKLDAMIEETKDMNITFVAWVPSRLTLFFQRLLEKTWKKNVLEVWPNLELFMWWGINIAPYKKQLSQLLPWDQVTYWQTYNASEWFFAIQDQKDVDDMLLATHHHIFYEFIAQEDIESSQPKALLLDELEVGKKYEIIITTDWGLRRYRIGDVIEVTWVHPVRICITWRTKSYLNTFGEELMSHTTDAAIQWLCDMYNLPLAEYVATTVVEEQGWYHQWFIDFVDWDNTKFTPQDLQDMAQQLDTYIQNHNSDYRAKRWWDILMRCLKITPVASGSFHKYLESKGKLWWQHKLKKLRNDKTDLLNEMWHFLWIK